MDHYGQNGQNRYKGISEMLRHFYGFINIRAAELPLGADAPFAGCVPACQEGPDLPGGKEFA
jgi:hypothetical protein